MIYEGVACVLWGEYICKYYVIHIDIAFEKWLDFIKLLKKEMILCHCQ